MTEPRRALYAHLAADNEVKAIVGDRIYQGRVPAGATKPLILIQPPISRVPQRDLGGVAYKRTRIQVTAMADTQKQAEATAKAVIDAVEGFSGMMAGQLQVLLASVDNDRQIDQDGVNEIHHHVDITITYKEV
ncbi:MAG TPA: DUF3168 domain-containing protein [Bacillota bacterium]|nr:DUF3168 domain-containing protein [Bacillota bacterium]